MMKKVKKLLALVLAMSMCASMMSVQALAAEVENDPAASVISVPEGPGDGSAEAPGVTVTVSVQEDGSTTTTTTQTDWEGKTEEGTAANGTTTTVTGTQTTTETETVDSQGRPVKQTGHAEGSETTKTETTETQVTEDVIIQEDVEEVNESTEPVTTDSQTQWDNWTEGEPSYEEEWEKVSQEPVTDENTDEEGWKVTDDPAPMTEAEEVITPNPLTSGDVTLDLTPGGTVRVEKEITVEEILMANDDWNGFDYGVVQQLEQSEGGKLVSADGKTTTEAIYGKDGTTIIGYKVTTVQEATVPGTPGEPVDTGETREEEKNYTTVGSEPEIPEDWNKDAGDILNEDGEKIGSVVMTKTPIYGEDGQTVIGYTITKTTTTDYDNTERTEAAGATTSASDPVKTGFALPEKPAESEKTENGVTTKVVVEDAFDEEGNHIGYITTTVRTDAYSGKELYRAEETIYGSSTAIHVTTTTDPTTQEVITDTTTVTTEVTEIYGFTQFSDVALEQERTTEINSTETTDSVSYRLVETEAGWIYVYTASMGAVRDNSTDTITKHEMTPDPSLNTNNGGWKTATNDIQGNGDSSTNYSWYVKYSEDELEKRRNKMDSDEMILIGYGLYSEFNMKDDQNKNHSARQYVLMDKAGNRYYGYCVELNKSLVWGDTNKGAYTEQDIGTLVGDDLYFKDGEAAVNRISSVANNGYWGQAEGLGSLQAVKDLLTREGYADVAESITDGQAMAATQAAIWKYGTHANGGTFNNINEVIEYYYGNVEGATKVYNSNSTDQTYVNIETLFNVLTGLAEHETSGIAETIDASDLTGAAIILDKKNGQKTINGQTHDTYESDLAFTLAVSTSSINGDLVVHVYQGGELITTKRLAGSNDGQQNYATIHPDENGTYTIPDVTLAENVTITLNLEGTQHLADGVYVYQCDASQNFVGLESKHRDVDLSVDMVFSVEADPPAQMTKTTDTVTKKKTEILTEKRHGARVDTRTGITEQTTTSSETTGTVTTLVYADVTVTEVTTTESGRAWTEDWEKTYTYPTVTPQEPVDPVDPVDPDIPDEPIPTEPEPPQEIPPVDIPDQEIPLDDVPKTGDVNALWLGLTTLLSGGGLVGLLSLGRKGREDA